MAKRKEKPSSKTSRTALQLPLIRAGVITQLNQDNKVVVLDPQTNKVFMIDGMAADLWLMMDEGRDSAEIMDAILTGVSASKRQGRLKKAQAFLKQLASLNLVV